MVGFGGSIVSSLIDKPNVNPTTAAWGLCLLLTGCGGAPPTFPVSGTLRLDGEALAYGTVRFVAEDGTFTVGAGVQPSGEYTLAAREGVYAVTVVAEPPVVDQPVNIAFEGGLPPNVRGEGPRAPAKYGDIGLTPLRCTVDGNGAATFDIDLES